MALLPCCALLPQAAVEQMTVEEAVDMLSKKMARAAKPAAAGRRRVQPVSADGGQTAAGQGDAEPAQRGKEPVVRATQQPKQRQGKASKGGPRLASAAKKRSSRAANSTRVPQPCQLSRPLQELLGGQVRPGHGLGGRQGGDC